MKIRYEKDKARYFDVDNHEIFEGDIVWMGGRERKVYLSEDGYLGTDATNPHWIKMGRAVECQYGIYLFDEKDEPKVIRRAK